MFKIFQFSVKKTRLKTRMRIYVFRRLRAVLCFEVLTKLSISITWKCSDLLPSTAIGVVHAKLAGSHKPQLCGRSKPLLALNCVPVRRIRSKWRNSTGRKNLRLSVCPWINLPSHVLCLHVPSNVQTFNRLTGGRRFRVLDDIDHFAERFTQWLCHWRRRRITRKKAIIWRQRVKRGGCLLFAWLGMLL